MKSSKPRYGKHYDTGFEHTPVQIKEIQDDDKTKLVYLQQMANLAYQYYYTGGCIQSIYTRLKNNIISIEEAAQQANKFIDIVRNSKFDFIE